MKRDSAIVNILTLSMLAAALIHLWIIPLHWAHAAAHGLLFLILGVLQVAWSFIFVKDPSVRIAKWGVYVAGGSITLWALTRLFPAPFGHGVEEITPIGSITKIIELSIIFFLLVWLRKKIPTKKITKALALSVALGFFVYIGAKASEPLFPFLSSERLHHRHEAETHPGEIDMPNQPETKQLDEESHMMEEHKEHEHSGH